MNPVKKNALNFSTRHLKLRFALALVNGWESFGNTHPKGANFKKFATPLSIADLPVYIWLRSHVYRSYPHIALITMQTRTQSLIPCSTRSLSLYGCISARVSPTYNLTVRYNYSQRSAFVKFPCKRFSLSLLPYNASDTYSYHTLYVSIRKTGVQK